MSKDEGPHHGCGCDCHVFFPRSFQCGTCRQKHPVPAHLHGVESILPHIKMGEHQCGPNIKMGEHQRGPRENKMKTEEVKDLFRSMIDLERARRDVREANGRYDRLHTTVARLTTPATFDMPCDVMSAETHEKFVQYEGKTFRVRAKGKDVTIVEVQVEEIR